MKHLLFLLAVASTTVALWIALGTSREEGPAPRGGEDRQEPATEERPEPLAPPEVTRVEAPAPDAPAEPDPGEAVEAAPAPPAVATPAADEGDRALLRGTIVVTDQEGLEHPHTAGKLTLFEFENAEFGIGREVTVTNGAFQIELGAGSSLQVGSAVLEERPVAIQDERSSGRHPLPEDLFLELRGSWGGALTLEVKDAATGAHLDEITLVPGVGFFSMNEAHPGPASQRQPLLEDGVSPIDLSRANFAFPGKQDLHVHSPGYAWGRLRIDTIQGGEQLIALQPGSALEVSFSEQAPPGATFLLQGQPDSSPVFKASVAGKDRLAAEGLPAGKLTARVILGEWYRGPKVLAQAPVELLPGATAVLDLDLETPEAPENVSVRGRVTVPLAWEIEDPTLHVELRDVPLDGGSRRRSPELEEVEPGIFTFGFDDAQPGLYQATLRGSGSPLRNDPEGLRYAFGFEVGPGGEDDLRLEVPPPATVIARTVDGAGTPVELDTLMWSPRLAEGVRGGSLNNVPLDPDTGTHRFLAPVGALRFGVHGGWALVDEDREDFTVLPGENRFVLSVQRLYELTLIVRDGETVVPWNQGWKAELTPVEGAGRKTGWGSRGGNFYLIVDRATRYRLELSDVPGFEPVPPVELDLGPGGVREHVIELQRAR